MISYYKFADIVIRLEHENDELFKEIHAEIKPYYTEGPTQAAYEIILIPSESITIPKRAVRISIDLDKSIYSHEKKSFIYKKDSFAIDLDYNNKKITFCYRLVEKDLQLYLRAFIKWIFIKEAEDQGMIYIHGAAAHYHGKNIVFAGDMHSGKSSCLMRMVQRGAKIISDDAVIINMDKIIPFSIKPTIDHDLSERFGVSNEHIDSGIYAESSKVFEKVDLLFFVKIWNNETSEINKASYDKALLALMGIRNKEIQFNVFPGQGITNPATSKKIFSNYAELLQGTKCYEFFAGYDEQEVRKKLGEFVDEN
jgi:serine kinase of HPr protein (carbohydrate metabolism regulator)